MVWCVAVLLRLSHSRPQGRNTALYDSALGTALKSEDGSYLRLIDFLYHPQGRNKALYDSALGTALKYGNNVALRHARSGKFVDVQVHNHMFIG